MVNSLNFHDESWYKACNCLKKIWFQIHQTKGVHKTDTGEITSFKNFINHSQSIEYLMTRHQRS